MIFFLQGYHTSRASIATVLLMLAMYNDIQEKAFDEVNAVFESLNEVITSSDVSKLKYVEMVINETLRLFPPGIMFGRTTSGKVELGLSTKTKQVEEY